jgi:hypothetical protein
MKLSDLFDDGLGQSEEKPSTGMNLERDKAELRKNIGIICVIVSIVVGASMLPHFNGFDSVVAGLLFFMIPLCGLGMWLSGSLTRWYYDAWQKERMLEEVNERKQ